MKSLLLGVLLGVGLAAAGAGCGGWDRDGDRDGRNGTEFAEKVTDPVCGVTVDKDAAFRSTYMGEDYWFHSAECMRKFNENPQRYADLGDPD